MFFLTLMLLNSAVVAGDCEQQWVRQQFSLITTKACVGHWLKLVYDKDWTPEYLDRDTAADLIGPSSLTVADLKKVRSRFKKLSRGDSASKIGRILEGVGTMLENSTGFRDVSLDGFAHDYAPVMEKVLSGKRLVAADLKHPAAAQFRAATLRFLRNAVYARHGRSFKGMDLQQFFYGADAKYRFGSRIPKKNLHFSAALLTTIDKSNVALLKKWEKKARVYERQQ